MSPRIVRPVLVLAILLTAGSYAAIKEWQWQADAGPLLRAVQMNSEAAPDDPWQTDAVTVQPEQIFQD